MPQGFCRFRFIGIVRLNSNGIYHSDMRYKHREFEGKRLTLFRLSSATGGKLSVRDAQKITGILGVSLVARILQSHSGSVNETKLRKKLGVELHAHLHRNESEIGRAF
jgi:hypothetical protein